MIRILLDCDGVLADFVAGVNRVLVGAGHDAIVPTTFRFFDGHPAKETILAALRTPEFWYDLEPIPGAVDAVTRMAEGDNEILVVTASWESCTGWENARRGWLMRHFGIEQDRVLVVPGKRKHLVRGDVFVDDKQETVLAWEAHTVHGRAYLFDQPYNREWTEEQRVRGADTVRRIYGWNDNALVSAARLVVFSTAPVGHMLLVDAAEENQK